MTPRRLAIYLNDHLAGATLGVELVRRAARENAGNELGEFLRSLSAEIAEDRATLVGLMERMGIPLSIPKIAAGWAAEKLGRLKPNGQLAGYSPLSRLLELEGLAAGIEAKRGLWLTLAEIREQHEPLRTLDCNALAERAGSQRERVESHIGAAAAEAFAGD
jgi:hypothetical protein